MVWLPDAEKIGDMFDRFDTIAACDGQTDGWTDTHLATACHSPRYASCRAVKQVSVKLVSYFYVHRFSISYCASASCAR